VAARSSPPLATPTYNFFGFGIEAGLPSTGAQVIIQTRDGYLWTGTEGGLARFDGVRFVTFRVPNTPALGSNLIRCLVEDPTGCLWIGTQSGLCAYRDRAFSRIPGIDAPVADLACDAHGDLWIATLGQGLLERRDGKLISHAGEPGLPANREVVRVKHDSSDRIWIGFRDSGLASYAQGHFRTEPWANAAIGEINCITEAPAGTFWFGIHRGVLRWRKGRLEALGPAQGLPTGDVPSAFYWDAEGHFWVVSRTLYRAETATADAFVNIATAPVDQLRTMMQDREGNYWLGSSGTGMLRMRPSAFRVLFPNEGNVQSVTGDSAGSIWAPVSGQIMRAAADGSVRVQPLKAEESGNILSLFFDGKRLWIGTRDTLCAVEQDRVQRYPFARVRIIFQDRQGAVWFGSGDRGIVRYRAGSFESMGSVLGIGTANAFAFGEDRAGTIYIGLDGRLIAFRDGKATPIPTQPGLPDFQIRSIYPDENGDLWIGTKHNGLVLRHGNEWFNAPSLGETLGELVSTIDEDHFGRLWLGTARGIIWGQKSDFVKAELGENAPERFHVAGRNEGVEPSTVGFGSQPVSFSAPDGLIWFATRRGVVAVRPDQVTSNPVIPPVHIEGIRIDGVAAPLVDPLELPAGTHNAAIDYTALSFVRPDAVYFRYRLAGHDATWTEVGPRRTAFYTDLPPGRYRFEVTACNNDGVWNQTGAALTIEQRPRFYETWWFYTIGIVSGAGLIGGLHRRRTRSLLRNNERLEKGIAERTRALEDSAKALRASQETFAKAFHTQPDGIAICRLRDGAYLEINSSFTRITGYTAEDLIGRTPAPDAGGIWANPSDRDQFVAAVRQGGESSGRESPFRRKDGSILTGVASACCVDLGGEECLLLILRDVTRQRQLEDQLQHAQKMEAVGQLAGGVAHDYNNILTSTLMQLGLLLDSPRLNPEIISSLKELEKDANRAAALTRQLLTFSRRQVMQVKDVELNAMLENLFKMLRRLLGEMVRLEYLPAPKPVVIAADAGMIEQVVTNLCVNARDALGPNGGRLEVEVGLQRLGPSDRQRNAEARPGVFAVIRIADNGCGMPRATLQRLFEPFFTTKEFGKGTGLGLAIIYGIVKQHQGWIEVESEVGRGTTFRVFLPTASRLSQSNAVAASPPAGGGSETILLVEDEAGVRTTVGRALERCGYRVLRAANGEEAIQRWEEADASVDLLLSDMVMPKGISGLDLADRFRRDCPALRVIVTSGYSVDLQRRGALTGAHMSYLSKPYDIATLARAVRKCLDEA